jgi:hypothetical protein
MAERTPYRPSRGGSLLGVGTFQSSNAPAQALAGVSEASNQTLGAYMTYEDTVYRRGVANTIDAARIKFAQLEEKYPLDPDGYDTEANAYIDGVVNAHERGPQGKEFLRNQLRLSSMPGAQQISKDYVKHTHDENEAALSLRANNALAFLSSNLIDDPFEVLKEFDSVDAAARAVGADEQPTLSQPKYVEFMQNFASNLAGEFGRNKVDLIDDPAVLREEARKIQQGAFDVTVPEVVEGKDGERTIKIVRKDIRQVLGSHGADVIANHAEGRANQLEYEAKRNAEDVDGRAKYAATQNVERYVQDIYKNGYEAKTPMPSDADKKLAFGENWQTKFEFADEKALTEGSFYRQGFATPPSKRAEQLSITPLEQRELVSKAFDDADALIKDDPVVGIISVDEDAKKAASDLERSADNNPQLDVALKVGAAFPQAPVETLRKRFVSSMERAYEKWGVSPSKRYLLTNASMNGMLAAIDEPDEKGQAPTAMQKARRIQAVAQTWGEYQDRVFGQIFEENDALGVYSVLIDIESSPDRAQLANAIDNSKDLNKLVDNYGVDPKDIGAQLRKDGRLASMMNSLPMGDQRKGAWYIDAASMLAKQYVLNGMSESDASKKAIDAVLPFEFTGVDRIVRVPKKEFTPTVALSLTPFELRQTLTDIMPNLFTGDVHSASGAMSKEMARQQYQDSLFINARFVTNADGSGVNIADGLINGVQGNLLRVSDGNGGYVLWEKKFKDMRPRVPARVQIGPTEVMF